MTYKTFSRVPSTNKGIIEMAEWEIGREGKWEAIKKAGELGLVETLHAALSKAWGLHMGSDVGLEAVRRIYRAMVDQKTKLGETQEQYIKQMASFHLKQSYVFKHNSRAAIVNDWARRILEHVISFEPKDKFQEQLNEVTRVFISGQKRISDKTIETLFELFKDPKQVTAKYGDLSIFFRFLNQEQKQRLIELIAEHVKNGFEITSDENYWVSTLVSTYYVDSENELEIIYLSKNCMEMIAKNYTRVNGGKIYSNTLENMTPSQAAELIQRITEEIKRKYKGERLEFELKQLNENLVSKFYRDRTRNAQELTEVVSRLRDIIGGDDFWLIGTRIKKILQNKEITLQILEEVKQAILSLRGKISEEEFLDLKQRYTEKCSQTTKKESLRISFRLGKVFEKGRIPKPKRRPGKRTNARVFRIGVVG